MMKRAQDQGKEQEQVQSASTARRTQMATVVGSPFIAPGLQLMHSYLANTVVRPYLLSIADATGKLGPSDLAVAQTLEYGIMAAVTTAFVILLCRLQGTSLPQLITVDVSNPGQVVGRGLQAAAAALAANVIVWTYLDRLPALKTTLGYLNMHSAGDVLAIALQSARALILAPVFEELLYR
jgi:hypothetical protein